MSGESREEFERDRMGDTRAVSPDTPELLTLEEVREVLYSIPVQENGCLEVTDKLNEIFRERMALAVAAAYLAAADYVRDHDNLGNIAAREIFALTPSDASAALKRHDEQLIEQRDRYNLWTSHGHDGLYGDDGEMQCARCGVDYKRDSFIIVSAAATKARIGHDAELRLEQIEEIGIMLAEYELERGETYPGMFAKLSAVRDKLRAAIRNTQAEGTSIV